MAGAALQIDDDYCNAMGQYFINEGKEIEEFLNEYISILESIKSTSIKKGNVANALESYIACAGKIKGQINDIASMAQNHCSKYIASIDNADQYLF